MKTLNKRIKLDRSRGVDLITEQADSAPNCSSGSSSVPVVKSTTGSLFLCFNSLFRVFICVLPAVLFFSYHPVIPLGGNETMNFELSLPFLWLVLFDGLVLGIKIRERKLLKEFRRKWKWLLFPGFLTLTILWSLNPLRGGLTVGALWLLCIAVDGIYSFRGLMQGKEFRGKIWKWFFGATLVVCGWCVAQCVLDLVGVSREHSLMCAGCTYSMFGFPHPNGFAIEPQFMGNLLLVPLLVAMAKVMLSSDALKGARLNLWPKGIILVFVLASALFLTFSRGAIYAFLIGAAIMTGWEIWRTKKWENWAVWLAITGAFLFTLNLQGVMAQTSKTDDTYLTGVAKVLNHLSLGLIDVRPGETELEVVEKPVENFGVSGEEDEIVEAEAGDLVNGERSAFDGYVAESTDTRLRLSGAALTVWRRDFSTMMFGVGLGGAGRALYESGLSPAPKEIVQNQYASLLLETGVVGVLLAVFSLGMIVKVLWVDEGRRGMWLAILVAYGVSLCFFSGLPNALHIYLLPGYLAAYYGASRKKMKA